MMVSAAAILCPMASTSPEMSAPNSAFAVVCIVSALISSATSTTWPVSASEANRDSVASVVSVTRPPSRASRSRRNAGCMSLRWCRQNVPSEVSSPSATAFLNTRLTAVSFV